MFSDWQRSKLTYRFNLQDSNRDGVIDRNDYMRVVDTMAKLRGWSADSPEYNALRETYQGYWKTLCKMADQDENGGVDLGEFLAGFERLLSDEASYRRYVEGVSVNLFDSVDLDKDDKINLAEFSIPQQAYGLTAEQAKQTFERLDVEKKGYLTREEVYARAHEFFYSDDKSAPGSWLFGVF